MPKVLSASAVAVLLVLAGCAGKLDYIPPTAVAPVHNYVGVDAPQDVVWKRMVKNLSTNFYVINNLDKDSGLINVSYSSDPERVIDCGRITSYVKNLQGERNYDFAAASAAQDYEIMDSRQGLVFVNRRLSVEGRANIVIQGIDAGHTGITVNSRYVITKTFTLRLAAGGAPYSQTDTISFNSGGSATFPGDSPSTCRATGTLERDILEAANQQAGVGISTQPQPLDSQPAPTISNTVTNDVPLTSTSDDTAFTTCMLPNNKVVSRTVAQCKAEGGKIHSS